MPTFLAIYFISMTFLASCQSTERKIVYAAWEKVGVEKRDILKDRITDAKNDQKKAGETFTDALDRLRAVYQVDGGELAKRYDKLKSSYDDAESDAKKVHQSIVKVETVANDLFEEWAKEDDEIKTSDLRSKSREQLAATKARYQDLHASLKTAETRMDPILSAFKDQVLYMKHNLNTQAIVSLKGETLNIEKDIRLLIERMNKSIAESDKFIAQLK